MFRLSMTFNHDSAPRFDQPPSIPDGVPAEAVPFFLAGQAYDSAVAGGQVDPAIAMLTFVGNTADCGDEDVQAVRKAHDLAILAIHAKGGTARWKVIEAGLTEHNGVDRHDADFAIRMAVAERTLRIGKGFRLQIPQLDVIVLD